MSTLAERKVAIDVRVARANECWGSGETHTELHIYCKSCQVSLNLIRVLEDHGTVVYWNIPEQRICYRNARRPEVSQ